MFYSGDSGPEPHKASQADPLSQQFADKDAEISDLLYRLEDIFS